MARIIRQSRDEKSLYCVFAICDFSVKRLRFFDLSLYVEASRRFHAFFGNLCSLARCTTRFGHTTLGFLLPGTFGPGRFSFDFAQ